MEVFYRNHLRALTVKVKFSGTFPAVLAAVEKIECLANPGGHGNPSGGKKILNPPEAREMVPGESGKHDPLFPLVVPEEQVPEQPVGTAQPEKPAPQENLPK